MRVLHVISGIDPRLGGPAVALAGMAAAQQRAGLEVSVAYTWVTYPADSAAADLRAQGVAVHVLGPCREPMSRHPGMDAFLRPLIAATDIVHIHALWEQVQRRAAHLARRGGVPYVLTPHGMLDPWNMSRGGLKKRLYLRLFLRRALQNAAAIHVMTDIEKRHLDRLGLRPPVIIEPLGLDWREFETLPPAGSFRSSQPALGERPYVLYLGRLDRGKGLELLVPAFAQVVAGSEAADAMLVIAGPDYFGFRAEVEAQVRSLGIDDRVIFTGMLHGQQRIAALRDAWLLCLPSWHENFGLAAAEAMACGTPVIVSDQVNLHPQIAAAGAGGVVPLDVEKLASELSRWLADPALRRQAATAGRSLARGSYDGGEVAGRWAGHYAKLSG